MINDLRQSLEYFKKTRDNNTLYIQNLEELKKSCMDVYNIFERESQLIDRKNREMILGQIIKDYEEATKQEEISQNITSGLNKGFDLYPTQKKKDIIAFLNKTYPRLFQNFNLSNNIRMYVHNMNVDAHDIKNALSIVDTIIKEINTEIENYKAEKFIVTKNDDISLNNTEQNKNRIY